MNGRKNPPRRPDEIEYIPPPSINTLKDIKHTAVNPLVKESKLIEKQKPLAVIAHSGMGNSEGTSVSNPYYSGDLGYESGHPEVIDTLDQTKKELDIQAQKMNQQYQKEHPYLTIADKTLANIPTYVTIAFGLAVVWVLADIKQKTK